MIICIIIKVNKVLSFFHHNFSQIRCIFIETHFWIVKTACSSDILFCNFTYCDWLWAYVTKLLRSVFFFLNFWQLVCFYTVKWITASIQMCLTDDNKLSLLKKIWSWNFLHLDGITCRHLDGITCRELEVVLKWNSGCKTCKSENKNCHLCLLVFSLQH